MDRLEKYITENREGLDLHVPSPPVWDRISRDMQKRTRIKYGLRIAASLLLFISVASGVLFFTSSRYNILMSKRDNGNPVLIETEIYYNNLLKTLFNEAEPILTGQPEIKEELRIDIARIDSICIEIRGDLEDNIANQEVIEALIQNYKIKIRLLEDMMTTLKEMENNSEIRKSNEL